MGPRDVLVSVAILVLMRIVVAFLPLYPLRVVVSSRWGDGGNTHESKRTNASGERMPPPRSPSSFDARDYVSSDERRRRREGKGGGQEYKKQRMKYWQDTAFVAQGLFKCLRYAYDKLFWYGIAQEDEDDKTVNLALDFKDLMEMYDADGEFLRGMNQMERRSNAKQSVFGGGNRADDWSFRWNPGVTKREEARKGYVPFQEEREWFEDNGEGEEAGPNSLSQKALFLHAKKNRAEDKLKHIKEKLHVLDITLELWLKRANSKKGEDRIAECDPVFLRAKKRVYKLREQGSRLNEAMLDLYEEIEAYKAEVSNPLSLIRCSFFEKTHAPFHFSLTGSSLNY